MMSYTFSKREKVLLVILALILIGIIWYMLVYQTSAKDVIRLNGEIAETDSAIALSTSRVSQMAQMQREIEELKAAGARQLAMPKYDNLQPLMIELDNVMSKADAYEVSFDQLDTESTGYVKRGVSITYSCASYAAAEDVIHSMADCKFPCSIDSMSIVESSSAGARTRLAGSGASASIHVTFYEEA